MRKNEKIICLAIRLGYVTIPDIIDQTGLGKKTVEASLNALCFAYNTVDVEQLADIIVATTPTAQPPTFTSHDCVIVDAALARPTAAHLLNQVLGENYCQALKSAL